MDTQTSTKPAIGRYIDIRSDWGFKHIFSGAVPSKDILIQFIDDLLGGKGRIRDLTYGPTEHLGETAEQKKVIFDLRCTTDDGAEVIVEMQRMDHENLRERMVFSTSRLISNQYPKGAKYWDFQLPEVIFIGVLEFRLDDDRREHYLKHIKLVEGHTGEIFYDKLSFILLELPNFAKDEAEIESDVDRWFWLLNNLSRANKVPTFMDRRVFPQVFQISEVSRLTKEERMAYEASLQDRWVWDNAISLAERKAATKAAKEADQLATSRERAKAEKLLAKERTKAKQERTKAEQDKIQSAKSLKATGALSDKQIAESLKLPLDVVKKL
ncbi:Rpn family recombination-promoting nuclease/putative transposase [Parapedobacter tibetensis]|uniref:Rpn family recombination-promoting nuclease/putative transposase n=1 Tax=Parapedobacter tibetensis TaxID=2972951 RepID=UPI00214DB9A9|nr:Rpn family recombination-promoting nuclease/putative transposase [Parapedobacter tibetensis]